MPSRLDSLGVPRLGQQLLAACGVSDDLVGANRATEIAAYAVAQAASVWPDTPFHGWQLIAAETAKALAEAALANASDAASIHAPLPESAGHLANLKTPRQPTKIQGILAALLGRAVVVAASAGQQTSTALISGLHSLQAAHDGKGRQQETWRSIPNSALTDKDELSERCKVTKPIGVVGVFLAAALRVLQDPVRDPATFSQARAPAAPATDAEGHATGHQVGPHTNPISSEHGSTKFEPSITVHLADAEVASVAEKLGYPTHSQIFPGDLREITRKLRAHANGKDGVTQALARYALMTLYTGWTEDAAGKLGFSPTTYSVWLAPERGGWCWNFATYRDAAGRVKAHVGEVEEIFIPFPAEDACFWRELHARHPDAENARALIEASIGRSFTPKEFRRFLQSCGDTAHPAYRARFSRSLWCVYLQETGSDMSAALQTGHFSACAPAALFYFGASQNTIWKRATCVYRYLELGDPEPMSFQGTRMGRRHLSARIALRTGWPRLVADINLGLTALKSSDDENKRLIANGLMEILCAAFIVATAARGSRLDCLTFGALLLHPSVMTLLDKDAAGGQATRLLPKTTIVEQIIAAACGCHQAVLGGEGHNSNDPLFVSWATSESTAATCMEPSRVRLAIRHYFGAEHTNFARSAWVTHLDEQGCERWLIRALTGHARDVTRTHGAYMDMPPILAAERLCASMEAAGRELLGPAQIIVGQFTAPALRHPARPHRVTASPHIGRVPDPRGLLAPLSPETLAGWAATERARHAIVEGRVDGNPGTLAALCLALVDLLPESSICLQACTSPQMPGRQRGVRHGLDWARPHFTHATWLPIQNTTFRFLKLADRTNVSAEKLKSDVCTALRSLDPRYWPDDPEQCWTALWAAAAHFRRLEFPPSLLAASLPETPAPCLSDLSLVRLANDPINTHIAPEPPTTRRLWRSALPHDQELGALRTIVGHYTSTIDKDGELQERAQNCLKQVQAQARPSTPFGMFVYDWLESELKKSIEGKVGRLDTSSVYTYLGILIRRNHELALSDPYEWTEQEWLAWLRFLQRDLSLASDGDIETSGSIPKLQKASKEAVLRLVRNLTFRGFFVPALVRTIVSEGGEVEPSSSASATVLTDDDISAAMTICRAWTAEEPLDQVLLLTRAEIQNGVPTRTNEVSSLARNCVTSGGALVIERYGYKVHKTHNAIRCIQLQDELLAKIQQAQKEIDAYRGSECLLLLRGHGGHDDGARDAFLSFLWSSALKLAAGDQHARPHGVRAKALQDIAWPGWSGLASRVLRGVAGGSECCEWSEGLFQSWTQTSFAAIQAGHGDLRSALGNYMAGWSLVFHFYAIYLMRRLELSPAFLDQLAVKRNTLAAANTRAVSFDPWDWLESHIGRTDLAAKARTDRPRSQTSASRDDKPRPTPTGGLDGAPVANSGNVIYVCARILGMTHPEAVERTRMSLSAARVLERIHIPESLKAAAVRRARAAPTSTGDKANQKLLFESAASSERLAHQVIDLILRLPTSTRLQLFRVSFDLTRGRPAPHELSHLWVELASVVPSALLVRVHRPDRHLTGAEEAGLKAALTDRVVIKRDDDVGACPVLKIIGRKCPDNRPLSSRLTSVFRAGLLAAAAIEFGKGAWDD